MAKPTGFMEYGRKLPSRRLVENRVTDWIEIYEDFPPSELNKQAARCMDCGIPFCHEGCPLGNIIPDWNDLVYKGFWEDAIDRLHATNNFPEFTGRLCPAPCESACVLGINDDPVTIKQVELTIIENAWDEGWISPQKPSKLTGKRVAVIGSGPAGLAAAQQLCRAGHQVTVVERDDRIGGLLRYGIPEFKMEKKFLDRRLNQMEEEGVVFQTKFHIGIDIDAQDLIKEYDAICLAGGATKSRDLPIPGRELDGIHLAMEYLPMQNRWNENGGVGVYDGITAKDKDVIILGGGDTGADCLGTAHRQGARSVKQYELLDRPPDQRALDNPWPTWDNIYRTSGAHEEGGERDYSILTKSFNGENGRVKALEGVRLNWEQSNDGRPNMNEIKGSEFSEHADLVLLALGFLGPEPDGMLEQLGVDLSERGNVICDDDRMTTVPGVFVAGDMARGQSLIVWAIAEGRAAAHGLDKWLMGTTVLPRPILKRSF